MKDQKVVFFDMGNTLLHFHFGKPDQEKDTAGINHLATYLRQFNRDIRVEDVKAGFFDLWLRGISSRRIDCVEYPVEGYLNAYLRKYGVRLDLNQSIEAMDRFYTEYRNNVWREEGLPQTLCELRWRGYKIGVVSNSRLYDEVMINCFKKAGLDRYIDTFTFSYYMKIAKPRREIFQAALVKTSAQATHVTMVGDSLEADIEPAEQLGWASIWFNRNNVLNETDVTPDAKIRSLKELLDLLT